MVRESLTKFCFSDFYMLLIMCFGITILATRKPTLDNAPPPAPSATPPIVLTSPCHPNPCQNGGTCHDFDAGRNYKCICPVGFEGSHCQGKKFYSCKLYIYLSFFFFFFFFFFLDKWVFHQTLRSCLICYSFLFLFWQRFQIF